MRLGIGFVQSGSISEKRRHFIFIVKTRMVKSGRKNTRKNMRKNMRKMNGGNHLVLSPMPLDDTSMVGPSKMSMAQGGDFFGYHAKQHGGMAPVGYTGMLDASLRASARVSPLDQVGAAIVGLKDQTGGKRKRRSTKRRSTKRRSTKRSKRRSTRRQNGGMRALGSMDVGAPSMLLQGPQAHQALSTMHQDWKLAQHSA